MEKKAAFIKIIAILVIVTSMTVIIAWFANIRGALSIFPNAPTMKMNTALGFLFSGIWLLLSKNKNIVFSVLKVTSLSLVLLIGGLTIFEFITNNSFNFDNLLVQDIYSEKDPGKMSQATAFCFLIMGLGFLRIRSSNKILNFISRYSVWLVIFISFISIASYILQVQVENRIKFMDSMAIHTSLLFLIISLTFITSEFSTVKNIISGKNIGSRLFRMLIPFVILLPIIVGFLLLSFYRHEYLNADIGIVLSCILFIVISIGYIVPLTYSLNKTDKERKLIEERLKISFEKEKKLGSLKSRFITTASHQFRTPLAIIQSNSELIKMLTLQCSKKESLLKLNTATERIQNEILALTSLLDDVLILDDVNKNSSLSSGKLSTNILSICEELVSFYNENPKDDRIVLFKYSGKPKNLNIDPTLIKRSINNLLSNAFKYSESSPRMNLFFEKDVIKLTISDEGIGIPEEEIQNLFQPFHRGENINELKGTGLGLSIVKEYVELNGGKIEVSSELNKGTTFTISFPIDKH